MFRSFVLALLIALLPAPAIAQTGSCHEDVAATEASHSGHHAGKPADKDHEHPGGQIAPIQHNCIGCAPPVSDLAEVAALPRLDGIEPPALPLKTLLSALPEPDTPPPRTFA